MNTNIKIFTVIFTLICFENIFRCADWIGEWTETIVD